MRGFVAPTDHGWYDYLRARPDLNEVNFWRPGAGRFVALGPGEPFFFKLKSPHNAIGGFGRFSRYDPLPLWMAWDVFGEANGVSDLHALRARLSKLPGGTDIDLNRTIGCITIASPRFFAPGEWVPAPADWSPSIVRGCRYDVESGIGRELWHACLERAANGAAADPEVRADAEQARYGTPQLRAPRLGQASFQLAVQNAYGRACAVTSERSLPALEAGHIVPYGRGGTHAISNGILLRRDVHRLFDLGFVTVRPDRTFAVSHRLREEFGDGRVYYELEGRIVSVPEHVPDQPDPAALEWHGDMVFRG